MITGGDSGIGRAVALAFAREGADVLISYLPTRRRTGRRRCARSRRPAASPSPCPATSSRRRPAGPSCERAVDEFGRIDVLVSNAAYQMSSAGRARGITTEQLDRVIKTNLYALFWLCKAAAAAHPAGRQHHHHLVGAGVQPVAAPARLRHDQGRHRQLHQGAGRPARREGHPGQLGGAGPGVDAADPGHDPGRSWATSVPRPRWAGPRSPPSWRRSTCSWPRGSRGT